MKWYPDKKGLITGLAVAGFGAGALFFAGPASTLLPPPAGNGEAIGISQILLVGLGCLGGWRLRDRLEGVLRPARRRLRLVAVLLGASLLCATRPRAGDRAGWEPPVTHGTRTSDLDWREMLNTPLASMLWLTFIFGATSGLMAIGQWTPMMAEVLDGHDLRAGLDGQASAASSSRSASSRSSMRWAASSGARVSDIIDRPRAMMIMFLIQGMAFMLLVSVAVAR